MKYIFLFITYLFLTNQNSFAQKLYPISLKEKWGYMNSEGKVIITPKYDLALNFNEGFAVVALNNLPCLIDMNEKRIIDTGLYQFISKFNDGYCAVKNYKNQWSYINSLGKVVLKLDTNIYEANPFYNGIARVSKKVNDITQKFGYDISNLSYRFAYIKKDGSYLSDFIYKDAEDFKLQVARVRENTKMFLIDNTFKKISEEYTEIGVFNENLAVFIENGKFGYLNDNGTVSIPAQFEFATPFNNGFAQVEIGKKVCFINKSGLKQFEPIYDNLIPFSEGFAGFLQNGKYGFINEKGTILMQPYYDEVGYFLNGICPVRKGTKWGAINQEGKQILKTEYDYVSTFEDGIAEIILNGVTLYVNTKGVILPIWE